MTLPRFRFHPDPIATGAIKKSDKTCQCCGKARGYIYTASFYSRDNVTDICPWCISDGSTAKKYDGSFVDDYPLLEAGIPMAVIIEICERTPGFASWQQEIWQTHCDTACEFHGDAEKHELEKWDNDSLQQFLTEQMLDEKLWEAIVQHYEKGGDPAIYKFKCPSCGKFIYSMDFS